MKLVCDGGEISIWLFSRDWSEQCAAWPPKSGLTSEQYHKDLTGMGGKVNDYRAVLFDSCMLTF